MVEGVDVEVCKGTKSSFVDLVMADRTVRVAPNIPSVVGPNLVIKHGQVLGSEGKERERGTLGENWIVIECCVVA
jgi:hypothetical protein